MIKTKDACIFCAKFRNHKPAQFNLEDSSDVLAKRNDKLRNDLSNDPSLQNLKFHRLIRMRHCDIIIIRDLNAYAIAAAAAREIRS